MDSRLDRLITLLEDGSDEESKRIAATKIGGIVKLNHSPAELSYVLKRIIPLLKNVDQSTRVHAGIALGEIARNIRHFDPRMAPTVTVPLPTEKFGKFVHFSPMKILSISERLVKSEVKRKIEATGRSSSRREDEEVEESSSKRRKVKTTTDNTIRVEYKKKEEQESEMMVNECYWPFHRTTDILLKQLFSPIWYFRHGAAIGLKEVLNYHYESAGMYAFGTPEHRKLQNLNWLEDCGVKILTVLTLDRFCDFFGDNVVAPVREECAKVLGIIIKGLTSENNLKDIIRCLEQMMTSNEWEARHSALLGFTYIIDLRRNIFLTNHSFFVRFCLPPLLRGLSDQEEDVISQAALSILPMAEFVTWQDVQYSSDFAFLSRCLWVITKEKDDISTHSSNVVKLLTRFYTYSSRMTDFWRSVFFSQQNLAMNIPYLWKFLRHSLRSVRLTTIQSIDQLVRLNHLSRWVDVHHGDLIQYLFQNIVMERSDDETRENEQNKQKIRLITYSVLDMVIEHFDFVTIDRKLFGHFITMISLRLFDGTSSSSSLSIQQQQQRGRVLDEKLFLIPKSWFEESSAMNYSFSVEEDVFKMLKWGCISLSRMIVRNYKKGRNCQFITDTLCQLARSKWSIHRRILGLVLSFLPSKKVQNMSSSHQQNQNSQNHQQNQQQKFVDPKTLECVVEIIKEDMKVHYNDINGLMCKLVDLCNDLMVIYRSLGIDFQNYVKDNQQITSDNCLQLLNEQLYYRPAIQKIQEFHRTSSSHHQQKRILKFRREIVNRKSIQDNGKSIKYKNTMYQYLRTETNNVYVFGVQNSNPPCSKCQSTPNLLKIEDRYFTERCVCRELSNFGTLKSRIENTKKMYDAERTLLHHVTISILSCGVIKHQHLPANVSSIVRSLIYTLKIENETVQKLCAKYLGMLTRFRMDLSNKITLVIMDEMMKNQPKIEKITDLVEDENESGKKKKRKKKKKMAGTSRSVGGVSMYSAKDLEEESMDPRNIIIRGMRHALTFVCSEQGDQLFNENINKFLCIVVVKEIMGSLKSKYRPTKLGKSLFILREIIPKLSKTENHIKLLSNILPKLVSFLALPELEIVEEAGHAISALTKELPIPAMQILYRHLILPLKQYQASGDVPGQIGNATNVHNNFKLGCVFTIHRLIQHLQLDLLPFVVLFILPLLKLMSDPDPKTRTISSSCFGLLIKLLPLENATANPPGFDMIMTQERIFLEQLLDASKIPEFVLPPIISNVTLRPYQKEGVSWLGFLNRFHLHGILCDDMGLGKTLQTICIMAYDIYHKKKTVMKRQHHQNLEYDHVQIPLSIIVAPGTLVDHWYEEFQQFCPSMKVWKYTGVKGQRVPFWDLFDSGRYRMDVIVMSYEICRNDVEYLRKRRYNYFVLDEGHIIRNPKSKVTQAIKSIVSEHRLVLSGTPVQNSALELWSLFDFLMPGFLGRTSRAFQGRYGRSISRSREAKVGSTARAAGVLALESLHKQVLPFILRRLKEDVLDDLPPKIIQDYYCHLSALQRDVMGYYDRFIDVQGSNTFHKLEFLRKLVIHPSLVLKDINQNHDLYRKLQQAPLSDYRVSPKLIALKQLLIDTGIASMNESSSQQEEDEDEGEEDENDDLLKSSSQNSGHRALIFCQYQSTVETLIDSLLKKMKVRFLRLDGSVNINNRQGVVKKFNEDPSFGLLLLTKRIGGYGLNLTGADMVIFVEHDYNFAVDKQAMDRCHRIGQKKVVNVYRVIVKDSIEEEKMGLQKFKKHVADSIINSENTSLGSLGTSGVIDKFG